MTTGFSVPGASLGIVAHAPLWKPLNKGYEGFPELFSRYARISSAPHSPELRHGLEAFLAEPAVRLLRRLGQRPVCLIEGIACPWNGTSLRRFLGQVGLLEPSIHAIDIMDLQVVAELLGYELPDLSFSVGDAAHLDGWNDHSVQLLVQDHLLNCAPHAAHRAIVSEAARLLSPGGVWILNFSVEPQLGSGPRRFLEESERLLGRPLSENAYSLCEALPDVELLDSISLGLIGSLITLDNRGRSILVTPPHGNFEFYFSPIELERLLAEFELRIVYQRSEAGLDQHGNRYQRYRTLVKHDTEQ